MNRLKNYFDSSRLAHQHLTTALEMNARRDHSGAIRHLAEAMLNMRVAMNCFTSLAFHKKPKAKRRPSSPTSIDGI